jgi:RND family efflux transporter MFP subunit
MTKKILCGLVLLPLLGGCGKQDQVAEIAQEIKQVPAIVVTAAEFTPMLEVAGALEPALVTTVAAEASGTVARLGAEKGDLVATGQELVSLASGQSLEAAGVQSARTSLSNAQKNLALVRSQTLESEKQAQLAIAQATENIDNLRRSGASTEVSIEAQIASAESGVALARLNLQNAEKSLNDLRQNQQVQETSIRDDRVNTIANAVNTFASVIQQADIVLGVTDVNDFKNDPFEVYLGFKDPQSKIDATNAFRQTLTDFQKLDADYAQNPALVTGSRITGVAQEIRETLRLLDIMLQNTTTGADLSEMELANFRSQTTGSRSAIEGIIQGITAIDQRENNFVTTRPQQVQSAELGVANAREQLLQAEKALEQIRSGGDVNLIGTQNQIAAAENQLEQARSQAELVKKQNEIGIQGANAGIESAADALSTAELRLSKLTVFSPLSGTVTDQKVEAGMTVAPGTPLFEISQTRTLLLKGDIPLDELVLIEEGMAATVAIDAFGEKKGVVTTVSPLANEQTRRVEVEISIDNADGAIPARIFATAQVPLKTEPEVIMIPYKSLVSQNPPALLVIGEGEQNGQPLLMAEKREIETGRRNGDLIEVLAGLTPGETIIPEPVLGLQEGDRVTMLEVSPTPSPPEKTPGLADPDTKARQPEATRLQIDLPVTLLPFRFFDPGKAAALS